jgi:hypothetical protein
MANPGIGQYNSATQMKQFKDNSKKPKIAVGSSLAKNTKVKKQLHQDDYHTLPNIGHVEINHEESTMKNPLKSAVKAPAFGVG